MLYKCLHNNLVFEDSWCSLILSYERIRHDHLIQYVQYRSELIKKFEYNKIEILIRPYFCTDIKNLIISFL